MKGKSLREHIEVINHAEAIDFLQEGITLSSIDRPRDLNACIARSKKTVFHSTMDATTRLRPEAR
ncbi:hypothetical protein Back11_15800 [Paenibacillus baekrokdamisoli]|uniref:Uncharacterized protein n=1 Tax=Paenibacillus baekrokdamisoli TaxID=1712516 RepID=A0A3G9IVS5_9BACL|nr:hypothetical protein [Paenibacillus baekrokdamisoli]MBB3073216.1 hypothetical protein [Paenibacillus baekrokdamisoli]BBH20235.1 hypothetical protein Back11_15800 [Paenibacillus baekrokdamisoli]